MSASLQAKKLFEPYMSLIENRLQEEIQAFGPDSGLKDACRYALLNGGKRYRPAIVLMVAEAIGKGFDASHAALGVEFFHTSSLIADDLPCMDNANLRREKPTLHKEFNEATALLASYTLIAEAYGSIHRNATLLKRKNPDQVAYWDKIAGFALENVTHNGGLHGITGGQFDDLYPPDNKTSTIREVIRKKTVTLFEIAFVFGWLFGGGDPERLEIVKKAAYHFGMALQISDDLGDMEEDAERGCIINLALALGPEQAIDLFHEELKHFYNSLHTLGIQDSQVAMLGALLKERV